MPFRLVDTGWNRSGQFRRKLLRFLGVHPVRRNGRGGGHRSRQGHWAVRHGGHQPAAAWHAALGDPAFLFPSLEAAIDARSAPSPQAREFGDRNLEAAGRLILEPAECFFVAEHISKRWFNGVHNVSL
jgi:hypothetical protein